MKILNKPELEEFAKLNPTARTALERWTDLVSKIKGGDDKDSKDPKWLRFNDVLNTFNSASYVKGHIIFNIKGKQFRMDTVISFKLGVIKIVRIGTHKEYGNWKF